MKHIAHSAHWHYLTGEQIVAAFDEAFPNVTIQPNLDIVMQLKDMEVGTLELLENRTGSSVYRIRETGVVYQLFQPNGDLFEYDDYDSYLEEDPVDELIEAYASREPAHVLERKGKDIWVERKKPPRFRARYTPDNPLNHLSDLEWLDGEPDFMQQARLLRKAAAFLVKKLKK
ncbi:hypothetical protein [Chitinophaga japonensis]|uniref:Uncharacterized protein n=1 Tax=Chitinophaga japonensis TaxID=104662 RepID=A0A562SY91_CHIJA|nr:hypothetical protein [Chitinophaga japonensis]TWI86281.1 hypothetical protein LX66_3535 [Chitinophaga japonensis]